MQTRAVFDRLLSTAFAAAAVFALEPGASAGEPTPWGPPPTGTPSLEDDADVSVSFPKFGRRAAVTNLPSYVIGTTGYRHEFDADFDDLPGDLSVDEFSLWSPLPLLSRGDYHLVSFVGYRATWLDTGNGSIIPDDDLHAFRLPVAFLHDASERFAWGALVMPGFSSDLSGSSSDAWSLSAAIGAGYVYSPSLRLFAGAYYSHGVDDDDLFIPGVGFIWRPHPDWEALLLPPIAGITYSVTDDLILGIHARYDAVGWAVQPDGSDDDLAVSMRSMRVGLKVEHRLWNRFWLYGLGGYSFARNLEAEEIGGRSLLDEDIDGGAFVQFGINFRY